MSTKRIIIKATNRTKYFKWRTSDQELREDNDGRIGRADSLEDAISLAKAHTGGSNAQITVKDA